MGSRSKVFFLLAGISLVSMAIFRFILGVWYPFMWIPLFLFVFFMAAGAWSDRRLYKEFLSMKTTKQGMSMGALIALVLVLLVAINFIGARKYKTWDFSAGQINSLSEQSIKLVKSLDSDLNVLYFYKKGSEGVEDHRRAFIDLIQKYQDQSHQIKLQFVEVNERPDLAEKYGVTKGSGLVFVDYKGRQSKLEKIDEQELTGALVKVTREKEKVVYFVFAHGERDIEDSSEGTGVGAFKKLLEGNRYAVKSLSLLQTPEVPKDANLVVIAGPTQSFVANEIRALENYLRAGGSLIIALESKAKAGLDDLLYSLGVKAQNNFVVQVMDTPLGKAVNPSVTPATEFSSTNAITKPFGRGQFIAMRLPTALEKGLALPKTMTVEEIVSTGGSSAAFNDTSFSGGGQAGPFALALAIKGHWQEDEKAPEFNVVVFGDVDFMSNQLLYQNLNRDLALNAVASLVKEENVISISPKEVGVTQLNITENQFYLFVFGFIIPLPVIFMVTSGLLWFRRRYA